MFSHHRAGEYIKSSAKVLFWVNFCIAMFWGGRMIVKAIGNHALFGFESWLGAFIVGIGFITSYAVAELMYGFGVLIEDTKAIKEEIAAERNCRCQEKVVEEGPLDGIT